MNPIRRIFLCFLLFATLLMSGCRITLPEEVAVVESSQVPLSSTTSVLESEGASASTTSSSPAESTDSPSSNPVLSSQADSPSSQGRSSSPQNPVVTSSAASLPVSSAPKPVDPEDQVVDEKKAYTCTLRISCETIFDHLDDLNPDKRDILPPDGILFAQQEVTFYEGESVFDLLLRETQRHRIHMEYNMVPLYSSNYIEGIGNLYEKDCGELSGWMYRVNGWFPNYGCSQYVLKEGDVVEWCYTCDLGRDLGQEIR